MRVGGDTHPSQRPGEDARAFHERCHRGPSLDWPPGSLTFENCPAYPCRTYRLRGWLHERWIGFLVRTGLVPVYEAARACLYFPCRVLERLLERIHNADDGVPRGG